MNTSNVETVLDICRRLDGIALALELAAARVPLLGVEGLRARLDERFNVLTTGSRAALPRHQTLRAVLEWSHALLSDAERTVFRRLAVFVGGFTLEAAQQVAHDETMDEWQVLDHLGGLVDKSLVVADTGDPPRYGLLETTRAYALERLAAAGETELIARQHAQVFALLFENSWAEFWHTPVDDHSARYRPDFDNLRTAFHWSSRNDPHLEIALAGSATWLWEQCAPRPEGIAACESAISHIDATVPPAAQARVLSELGDIGWLEVPVDLGLRALERAVALYRGLDDRVGLCLALTRRVRFLASAGDADGAAHVLAEVKSLEDPAWPPRLRQHLVWARSSMLRYAGPIRRVPLPSAGAVPPRPFGKGPIA